MTPVWHQLEAHASSPVKRHFLHGLALLDRSSYYAILVAMGMMTLLVSAQVFTRYALSSSIDSADELSRLFFVWAIFLAIPHGIKVGIHVGIDALVSYLPKRLQQRLAQLMAWIGAAMMAGLFWVSLGAVASKWQELMPTLPITAAVFYIAVLVCAGHSCLHLVAQALRLEPLPSAPPHRGGLPS
ncbi:TRAP transporter small permease [Halomonas heilongjiangensis]|uniref:TRAP transporter small permease protein n=1 Tax=Halomonas heilongjiangensis TaxID=1387883 RepID=A0A2N7TUQ7_9GAMM|nr:TRAP transporter small permease [Halomonas heilongjiangensis]PMR71914.1 TRAP transporter small permease [Halomonas heilongjiangensis]PXX87507.1 TRAP transporter permease DctQ [Halomonas heilongjiangensis]